MKKGPGSQDVLGTIQNIIANQLKIKPSEVLPKANLQTDLGAESLDALEITMYIEEAFDINIPDEEARKAKTVGDIADYVSTHLKKKS